MIARSQSGFTLIEVLVSLLIVSLAMLGMAGLITRSTVLEIENSQRSQAMQLARDMGERIQANRAVARGGAYDRSTAVTPAVEDCSGAASRVALDFCEWAGLLAGANESQAGSASSVLAGARGCVSLVAGTTNAYIVTVVWRGATTSGEPAGACGVAIGEDVAFLRTVTRRIELGRLDG